MEKYLFETGNHENRILSISDDTITFATEYNKVFWTLILKDEITWKKGLNKKVINSKDIKELKFEVDLLPVNGIQWNPINHAIIYVVDKNSNRTYEFFRIVVGNKSRLIKSEPVYKVCELILNKISEKYGIPGSYEQGIGGKRNLNYILYIMMIIPLLILVYFLLIYR